jgi:hypothetical protein
MQLKTIRQLVAGLLLATLAIGSCSEAAGTLVTVEIADNFAHEGFTPGDPLPGATVTLLQGDDIVLTTILDDNGAVTIDPAPGSYDVQVRLDSSQDPLCFWTETRFGVEFPTPSLELAVGFVCA